MSKKLWASLMAGAAAAVAVPDLANADIKATPRGQKYFVGAHSSKTGPAEAGVSHTFAPFNQVVDNQSGIAGLDPESRLMTGHPAGTYNAYSVSVQWSAIAGNPWSDEAIWAFTDTGDLNTVSTFYADPGPAPNSASNGNAVTLNWQGYMATPYTSPAPLYMLMAQAFSGSSANWDNVSVQILNAPRSTTNFNGDTTGDPTWNRPFADFSGVSGTATAVPYEVTPFYVDTTTDYEIVNNYEAGFDGFLLVYGGSFDPNSPLANGVAGNDDGTGLSDSILVTTLQAGTQYYLVTTGFANDDFGLYSGTISNANPLSVGTATLGLIPEPASLGMVAAAGLALLGRRRRAV